MFPTSSRRVTRARYHATNHGTDRKTFRRLAPTNGARSTRSHRLFRTFKEQTVQRHTHRSLSFKNLERVPLNVVSLACRPPCWPGLRLLSCLSGSPRLLPLGGLPLPGPLQTAPLWGPRDSLLLPQAPWPRLQGVTQPPCCPSSPHTPSAAPPGSPRANSVP